MMMMMMTTMMTMMMMMHMLVIMTDSTECSAVTDGSHQRDDRRFEGDQRDGVPEAKTVGSPEARNIQRRFGAGLSYKCS